jgi:hypothetical protein
VTKVDESAVEMAVMRVASKVKTWDIKMVSLRVAPTVVSMDD